MLRFALTFLVALLVLVVLAVAFGANVGVLELQGGIVLALLVAAASSGAAWVRRRHPIRS